MLLASAPAAAQGTASLRGMVRDAGSARPLIGALVTLGAPPEARTTRTDETGAFQFSRLAQQPYPYPLAVRQVGYEQYSQSITVSGETDVTVPLRRLTALDTVRVRDNTQGISGVVATASGLQPLANARVQIFGASVGQVSTDSAGRFYYPIQSPGAYLVRARVAGRGNQTVSVTVPPRAGVEVALLLDSGETPGAKTLEMAYGDFRERMLRRGPASAVVPRTELLKGGSRGLVPSLTRAPSFIAKGLRFAGDACVFVDGVPRPGWSVNAIDAETVEAVEVYAASGDRSRTLSARWPRLAPCGDTGTPRASQSGEKAAVTWVVVWLKH